ncbi:hypothetical protein GF339_17765 [candidate division KSB3 bacterium]|uniref:Putative zinc-finger domain-containing protein n=1 Tax=candidate division KSB3 bacterium TaxID=2044937 RepID=A0A9D5JYR5_9BACT|nr:hypothetical protein [candidate division KSB3 bacterium]MBD3326436.1 hypothetical protein [candidate division KSB3 bacterium]
MNCKWVQQHLIDYAEDGLDQRKRIAIEEHLGGCVACQKEFADLQQTLRLLHTLPLEEPPEAFWADFTANVMQKVRAIEPPHTAPPLFSLSKMKLTMAVAGILAMLGGMFFAYQMSFQKVSPSSSRTQSSIEMEPQAGESVPTIDRVAEPFREEFPLEEFVSEDLRDDMIDAEFGLLHRGEGIPFERVENSDEVLQWLISGLTDQEKDMLLLELQNMQ